MSDASPAAGGHGSAMHRDRAERRVYLVRGPLLALRVALLAGLTVAGTGGALASEKETKIKGGIIGREHRKLLADFTLPGARDQTAMRAGLAATQRLSCGYASASLVYRPDVIVFSAHQLFDDDKPDPDVARCTFEVTRMVGGEAKVDRYPLLLDTLDHGDLPGKPWTEGNIQDWAIVRLARPVPDIEPYRLPAPEDDASPGRSVVTASRTTENWDGSSKSNDRLVQSCHAVKADPGLGAAQGVMHLDCDVGPGASGGAVVVDAASGHPRYMGTLIAYSGKSCRKTGYDTCFSIGRRLDADLAARVRGTTAMGTPDDAPFAAAQAARLDAPRADVANTVATALATRFPAQDDPVGRVIATLYAQIQELDREDHAAVEPLLLQAFRALHDPDRARPEWPWLLLQAGRTFEAEGRPADAYQSYRIADTVAPDALKPALKLRMGLTTADAAEREADLREAYLAGGDALFKAVGAGRELEAFKAHGVPTDVSQDPDDD